MRHEIKHFGTSGEIGVLIGEVNEWLRANEGQIQVVAMSESQGGRIGDESDPFYFSLNIAFVRKDSDRVSKPTAELAEIAESQDALQFLCLLRLNPARSNLTP